MSCSLSRSLRVALCGAACLLAAVRGDVRLESFVKDDFKIVQEGASGTRMAYQVPDTFGYQRLEQQKKQNYDQFLRSNIDNEANRRNTKTEAPLDMLPCRNNYKNNQGAPMAWTRGETVEFPIRWNNPHDASCEFNLWTAGMTLVSPIRKPFLCGGGFQDVRYNFEIPQDFPGCETAEDGCFLQFYGHSVETRTYAICVDFVLSGGEPDDAYSNMQPAIHYHDSYDTAHLDSSYSGYRGQQLADVRDEVKAAIELRSHVHNGGLLPLEPWSVRKPRHDLKRQVDQAIKQAEQVAIASNKAAQEALNADNDNLGTLCFEGEMYSVVNNERCRRHYTNTYVTNVGYRKIMDEFRPKFVAAGIVPYSPTLKTLIGETPANPVGMHNDEYKQASRIIHFCSGNTEQYCRNWANGAYDVPSPPPPASPEDTAADPADADPADADAADGADGTEPNAPEAVLP